MRSLLTVISDESLLNRIKLIMNDNSINYFYAENGDDAANIAKDNEIAVAIVDFESPVVSGEEMCELLLSINPEVQFILFFEEKDTKEVLDVYNSLHINKLMCKEYLVLEDLPSLVDSCLHTYNRDEEIDDMDEELDRMNEMYLHPMQEMSAILNERLAGYDSVVKVFKESINFVLNTSGEGLKSVDNFVDRIINDYIHIFMIKEPDASTYFNRIHDSFNDPEGRKYFKFVNEVTELSEDKQNNILFCLDVITIGFDCFYPLYRGKIALSESEAVSKSDDKKKIKTYTINAIYEVRREPSLNDAYGYVINLINNILRAYTSDIKYAMKNNIIQYKADFTE